jgi:hypothetical protein
MGSRKRCSAPHGEAALAVAIAPNATAREIIRFSPPNLTDVGCSLPTYHALCMHGSAALQCRAATFKHAQDDHMMHKACQDMRIWNERCEKRQF